MDKRYVKKSMPSKFKSYLSHPRKILSWLHYKLYISNILFFIAKKGKYSKNNSSMINITFFIISINITQHFIMKEQ